MGSRERQEELTRGGFTRVTESLSGPGPAADAAGRVCRARRCPRRVWGGPAGRPPRTWARRPVAPGGFLPFVWARSPRTGTREVPGGSLSPRPRARPDPSRRATRRRRPRRKQPSSPPENPTRGSRTRAGPETSGHGNPRQTVWLPGSRPDPVGGWEPDRAGETETRAPARVPGGRLSGARTSRAPGAAWRGGDLQASSAGPQGMSAGGRGEHSPPGGQARTPCARPDRGHRGARRGRHRPRSRSRPTFRRRLRISKTNGLRPPLPGARVLATREPSPDRGQRANSCPGI